MHALVPWRAAQLRTHPTGASRVVGLKTDEVKVADVRTTCLRIQWTHFVGGTLKHALRDSTQAIVVMRRSAQIRG